MMKREVGGWHHRRGVTQQEKRSQGGGERTEKGHVYRRMGSDVCREKNCSTEKDEGRGPEENNKLREKVKQRSALKTGEGEMR